MALLRKIPFDPVDGFPFLERVNFEKLTMRLAGRALTQPAIRVESEEPSRDVFHHLVSIQNKLERLGMILSSSQASNAWIRGEAGIGKTVLLEALLRARAEKRLTSSLMSRPFYVLDPNSFAVATRGQDPVQAFDKALCRASEGGGVLLIDHMDDFLKTSGGSLDAALSSTLVTHLERNPEFQAVIVSNSASDTNIGQSSGGIGRLFQKLDLTVPPDDVELKKILIAKFKIFNSTHNVELTEAAADEIIRLLNRYPAAAFPGARPQNALKFADKVATYVHLNRYAEPVEVTETREKIRVIQDELTIVGEGPSERRAKAEQQLQDLSALYAELDKGWKRKFEPLLKARASFDAINTKLDVLRNKEKRSSAEDQQLNIYAGSVGEAKSRLEAEERALYPRPPLVSAKHVQAIFAQESGIPVSTLGEDKIARLQKLDGHLDSEIVRQEGAKRALRKAYFQREVGVCDPARPAGIFLFLGGTGLGKTELANVLAAFDGGPGAKPIIIRLSEFKGKEAGKKITGADPGLVGYEDGSCLEGVRKNGRAILLFDEAEKGDPSVFDVLMQVFEEGRITPSNSKVPIDLKDTIIILASNALKASDFSKEELEDESVIRQRLKSVTNADTGAVQWKPEFIARIDRVFVFEDLQPEDHAKIFRKEVRKINRDFSGRGISLEADDDTAAELVRQHNDPTVGGRLARKIANTYVRPKVTDFLEAHIAEVMSDEVKFEARLKLAVNDNAVRLDELPPKHPASRASAAPTALQPN